MYICIFYVVNSCLMYPLPFARNRMFCFCSSSALTLCHGCRGVIGGIKAQLISVIKALQVLRSCVISIAVVVVVRVRLTVVLAL